jgi:excisionase family DNA binding protein
MAKGKKGAAGEVAARVPAATVKLSGGETFYTLGGIAELFGMCRKTVWQWKRAGRLPGVKLGKQYYVAESTVKALLEGRTGHK